MLRHGPQVVLWQRCVFYMCLHSVRSLAMGEPVAGLHIRTHPSPVPLAGKSRASILQSDGVAHAYDRSGGDSMVVAARRQK